ncbi:GIY-YIG nuclease family protein [Mesobacillus subterraneus]|uniref:GIY-YIG domain-containing protein n=1 Tax=Mesobacillus subterraneus TaxID=285983 RepID=A0A427TDS1_9BACI|nr:GIY-YIG nuclease family protein [Mesobacillus subterraneus]RSD21080.1 hypothetical protein EJA10_22545 [Mesobacillus subterraneus]
MIFYIYKITCTINGKVYIGQTKNIRKRWDEHKYHLRRNIHHSTHMQRAFNKHGEESFLHEVVETCSKEQADEREKFWIVFYDSTNKLKGFNLESGGNLLKQLAQETKDKIGRKNKLNYKKTHVFVNSPESIIKRSSSNTGKKRSPEFIERMSEIAKKRTGDSNPFYGRTHSPEVKEKISKANRGGTGGGKPKKKLLAINLETKEEIIFGSKCEAAKNGFPSRSYINKVLNGTFKQYNGYTFKEI